MLFAILRRIGIEATKHWRIVGVVGIVAGQIVIIAIHAC